MLDKNSDNNSLPNSPQASSFAVKLYELINEPSNFYCVRWSRDGKSFLIMDPIEFASAVLPRYYRHSQLSSWIRQLNLYGFKKVQSNDKRVMEFVHTEGYFTKNDVSHLQDIARRRPSSSRSPTNSKSAASHSASTTSDSVEERLKSIRAGQTLVRDMLEKIAADNTLFWKDLVKANQAQQNQQTMVTGLVSACASMFLEELMCKPQKREQCGDIDVDRAKRREVSVEVSA